MPDRACNRLMLLFLGGVYMFPPEKNNRLMRFAVLSSFRHSPAHAASVVSRDARIATSETDTLLPETNPGIWQGGIVRPIFDEYLTIHIIILI